MLSAAELTLQELASFAGLAQENMNRAAGWRFLDIGRRTERAINTTRFARQFAYDEAGDEDLDILLTLVDCQITYRSRYLVAPIAGAGARPRGARPLQSALGRVPGDGAERAHRQPAGLKEHGLIERPQRLAVARAGDAGDRRGREARASRRCSRWSRTCSASPTRSGCTISRTAPMPAGRKS